MKNEQVCEEPINEALGNIISEYRTFEEFKELSDEQIFEIDQFLKSYAELIYDCFSDLENESGKVIEMNNNQNNLKAA
jgi:hypothetical protein